MLQNLPEEISLKIISYLSLKERLNVQRVSKTWLHLSMFGVKSIAFFGDVNDERCQLSFQLRTGRTAIRVNCWRDVNSVIKKCAQLNCIELFACDFEDRDSLKQISEIISKIKRLKLHIFGFKGFQEEDVISLTQNCTNIEALTVVNYGDHILGNCLNSVLKTNRNIKVLKLACRKLSFDCKLLPALDEFTLYSNQNGVVPDTFIDSLVESSENSLRCLKLYIGLRRPIRYELISRFNQLKDLRLNIEDDEWPQFTLKNLETFQFHTWSDQSLNNILKFVCQNRNLKILNLNIYSSEIIDDYFVNEICKHCDELKQLAINPKFGLTDYCLHYLLKLPKLEYIQLLRGPWTDHGLATFVTQSKSLKALDLGYEVYSNFRDTVNAFIDKARKNASQTYYLGVEELEDHKKEVPPNLRWKIDGNDSNDRRQIPRRKWEFAFNNKCRDIDYDVIDPSQHLDADS